MTLIVIIELDADKYIRAFKFKGSSNIVANNDLLSFTFRPRANYPRPVSEEPRPRYPQRSGHQSREVQYRPEQKSMKPPMREATKQDQKLQNEKDKDIHKAVLSNFFLKTSHNLIFS